MYYVIYIYNILCYHVLMIPFLELLDMTSQIICLYSIQLMPKKQTMNLDIRHTHGTLQKSSVDDFIRKIPQENG